MTIAMQDILQKEYFSGFLKWNTIFEQLNKKPELLVILDKIKLSKLLPNFKSYRNSSFLIVNINKNKTSYSIRIKNHFIKIKIIGMVKI